MGDVMADNQLSAKSITREIMARTALPLAMGVTVLSNNVNAQGLRVSDGSATELSTLSSGEQVVMENRDGQIQFAGHTKAFYAQVHFRVRFEDIRYFF